MPVDPKGPMSDLSSPEARLVELGLVLPVAPQALGLYRPVSEVGGLLYLSGHVPLGEDGQIVRGRLGAGMDVPAGAAAARRAGLVMLATLRRHLGSLDRVARLVKTVGLVQAVPEFTDHPLVVNGFSELIRDVWGPERGVAARTAAGVASLPGGMAVEIEAIFERV
jgi:enamine deaminase RidA (YjgF/YER057c/UK114 family)